MFNKKYALFLIPLFCFGYWIEYYYGNVEYNLLYEPNIDRVTMYKPFDKIINVPQSTKNHWSKTEYSVRNEITRSDIIVFYNDIFCSGEYSVFQKDT